MSTNINNLLKFLKSSPTSHFAIKNIEDLLIKNGYSNLKDNNFALNTKYFITRNDSSIIAIDIPAKIDNKLKVVSSHSDSPYYKIKFNPNFNLANYSMLNISAYGGMIHSSFIDIPLNIAGRVSYVEDNEVKNQLINFNKPMAIIPNLAIHLNREINAGYSYKLGKDIVPLFSNKNTNLLEIIKDEFNINSDIISHDLYVTSFLEPYIWGQNNEFITSPRLDNLECAYTSTIAFINSKSKNSISILCIFDNEEVGSLSYMGACSDFLNYILEKIRNDLKIDVNNFYEIIENSYIISADNAHALHPNYLEKYDSNNSVSLNDGIVIKISNNQSYTTDGYTCAKFIKLCSESNTPYQVFENHSAIRGGSTLGNLLNYHTSIKSIDIGLPQLAMHSANETAGTKDIEYMINVLSNYYGK